MTHRVALLIIISCTLLYRVRCHEGVYRFPEMNSNVEVNSIVPECFTDSVDAYVTQIAHQTVKGKTINTNADPGTFTLVVSKILEETLGLLDKFTVLVVAMVERNKSTSSLEFVFDYVELNIAKLSGCLEFLFDNGADVTDALTGYIFYSGFKYIFKADYGKRYIYENVIKIMFVRIEQEQWSVYLLRVPTEETYLELYTEVEGSLEEISKTYQQLNAKSIEWLSPQCLKWRHLLESNSSFTDLFRQVVIVDNYSVQQQYLQIVREFDSVKVMEFYVNVGKALDSIILETATHMMKSFLKLILRLIHDNSNKDNSFTQINRANRLVYSFLRSVYYFDNWMSYSKRLKSSTELLSSPAIKVLQDCATYCAKYNAGNFPDTVGPFLIQFNRIFIRHVPGIVLDATRITDKLTEYSVSQINIVDNMERNKELMKMLLRESSSGQFK